MEPFKALTFLAAAGIVSLVGAGAAGFYAGYSAGRGNLEEIKAQIANAPAAIAVGPGGSAAVSLKPVLEDIRALSKQVEALAAVKARPVADAESNKPVQEEIRALSRQVEALAAGRARHAADAEPNGKALQDDIRTLAKQVETLAAARARPADTEQGAKPVLDEIKALARQVDTLKAAMQSTRAQDVPSAAPAAPDYTETLQDIRDQVRGLNTKFEKQEPKAPRQLIDEIRSLSASVQALEPNARRAVAEEVRNGVAALQNAEPRVSRALMDEIHTISANVKPQDPRPQQAVGDQLRVLAASVDSLRKKLSEDAARGSEAGPEIVQLRQLVAAASDQFGRCQTQLASLAAAPHTAAPHVAQPAAASTTVAVSQGARREPSTVVFYDNVMLKKDQEKQYDEIGVRLALQSVGPRQIKVAVNRQGFGLSFGERKVFRSQDVECEINLMETNLNDGQARVSISCRR